MFSVSGRNLGDVFILGAKRSVGAGWKLGLGRISGRCLGKTNGRILGFLYFGNENVPSYGRHLQTALQGILNFHGNGLKIGLICRNIGFR